MAHFAKIENNIIVQVEVVHNDVATTEQAGITFLQNLYNDTATWKKTSYNNNIRKNFAGLGYTYDETRDAFIAPKPYESWILNETTCRWGAPVAYPNNGERYDWNETILNWEIKTR